MTQSWVPQQAFGGENTRIHYKPRDVAQTAAHPRQSGHQGDTQLRMTRHPHVAPHKSMLADDLKLSSDEEDSHTVNHDAPWEGHSRSAQSHGRRVRHSSSDSSDSNSSVESNGSSFYSHQSSQKARPTNVSPTNAQDPCSSKEGGQPSTAQWTLDKWWRKARKKSSSGEQDPSENIPGYPPSPDAQRAPSPARSWDSNQEYSPCQTHVEALEPATSVHCQTLHGAPAPHYPLHVINSILPFIAICDQLLRQHERKKRSIEENQQGKREKRESSRLAEEQLRRPWILSSEEDYEEEVSKDQRRTKEDREHRKRDQHSKHGWHTAQVEPAPPTLRPQEQKDKTKKTQACTLPRGSPTPPSPSPSSTWSSGGDSEYQAPITKVPADSTSQRPVRRRARDPSRSDAIRARSAPLQIGIPCEKQQSECRQKLYTLVPFGRREKSAAPSHRGLGNLVVHINLCLLKRVPDSTETSTTKKPPLHLSAATSDKQHETMRHLCVPDGKRKRKMENGVPHRERKRGIPDTMESSGPANDNRIFTETTHSGPVEEYLESKRPLSPLPDSPGFIKSGSRTIQKTSEKNRDKNRDAAVKPKMEVESHKCSQGTKPAPESWGPSGHRGAVTLPETQHHAEYYLHEAKRMKHRADAMVDKLGKAVNYVDAALSFMECGKAMEQGPLEAKSPYTMYAETVELIRYAMRLKSHSGPAARQEDKQLAVLCFRSLALLYWQMFRLKKDHALKYSKVLLDYFKTSSKVPTSGPCWNHSGKSPGGHSLSPNAKNSSWSSHVGNTSSSFINIPHRIHQMAANHLNITNSVLYSYEYWEVADNLAKENIEFFNYLNTLSGPLTLHSSIAHAVQYTRQALQWIRISAKLN
uniref:AF4/FMR2 C-terminal homology domain-containing protein n=1 Tax=Knipowitschia caucasica TaxID=637954 RepID=A0AAV2K2U1_KNICA